MSEPTKEIELGSEQALEDLHITIGGNRYLIHGFHRDFFEKLQKLPVAVKIQLMELTPKQLIQYTGEKKYAARQKVIILLSKKWCWKDTGDDVEITQDTIPDVPFTVSAMQSKMRSIDILEKIIEFFEGDDREVYTKKN
jgi:hypothetical protein